MDKINAVINGDRIECGKCRELLAVIASLGNNKGAVPINEDTFYYGPTIKIKCKHKDRGVYCNEVNEILL